MFKTIEGGVKGRLNNVKKNCTIGIGRLPLAHHIESLATISPLLTDTCLLLWFLTNSKSNIQVKHKKYCEPSPLSLKDAVNTVMI